MTWTTRPRPSARLRKAVTAAYQAFAAYRTGPRLATCHCGFCLEPGVEELLLATPPRHISFRLLCEYTWALSGSHKAIFDSDEYRHFLPRYFHFIAYGLWPNHGGDWQPTLRALGVHAYRERWPRSEVEIVDDYFDGLLERQLGQPVGWSRRADGSLYPWSEVEDLLSTLLIAGASVDRLIRQWESELKGPALLHAACMVDSCRTRGLSGPWWSDFRDQAGIVEAWLFREQTAQLFRSASDAEPDVSIRDLWSRSAQAIETSETRDGADDD